MVGKAWQQEHEASWLHCCHMYLESERGGKEGKCAYLLKH